eukprot:2925743-Rhodomonas_salina.1
MSLPPCLRGGAQRGSGSAAWPSCTRYGRGWSREYGGFSLGSDGTGKSHILRKAETAGSWDGVGGPVGAALPPKPAAAGAAE